MKALRLRAAVPLIALTASLYGTSQSSAQNAPSAETLQAARELAAAASVAMVAEMTTNVTTQVWPGVEAAIRDKNPAVDAATLAELRREFEQLQVNAVVEGMSDASRIYAQYFTAGELRELLAFYRTPTGAKVLSLMPRASSDLIAGMMARLQTLSATANQRFAAILQRRGFKP